MSQEIQAVPGYAELIVATFSALKELGGSGKNNEINDKAAKLLDLSDSVLSIAHLNSSSLTEVNYRLAWARTLLKNYGAIENSARSVWSITPSFSNKDTVDGDYIEKIAETKRTKRKTARARNQEMNYQNCRWKNPVQKFRKKCVHGEKSFTKF